MNNNQKIVDKCRKLLAMAKDACNENESAIAMKQLQKILAKHNLSLDNIPLEDNPIGCAEWSYSSGGVWSRNIIGSICQLYFCKLIFSKDKTKQSETYHIFGNDLNREVAMEMAQNAVKLINKLSNKGAKEYAQSKGTGKIDYKYRVSFRNGAAHRIYKRCQELIEAAKKGKLVDDDGSKFPALAHVYDQQLSVVEDYINKIADTKQMKSSSRSVNPVAYNEGSKAGDRVKLKNDQIGRQQDLLN